MATVEAKVYRHHRKADGTYNVKIRVYHNDVTKFIDTEHFVSDRQLKKDPDIKNCFLIKDAFVNRLVNLTLDEYRTRISNLGKRLKMFNCEALRDHLSGQDNDIDFIKFCTDHIKQLKEGGANKRGLGKDKSASNLQTVKNSLIDFFKRDKVLIIEIDVSMLEAWESYLKTKRTIKRINQFGNEVTTIQKPCSKASVHNYMRDLRVLFNAAMKKFNKKSLGIIRIEHYPFDEYKVGDSPLTKKRNCEVETIKSIIYSKQKPDSRAELARDMFMLSFLMCGINSSDIYQCTNENVINGRLDYNRSKTQGKRKDNAFISIKVVKQANRLLSKYLGKIPLRYSTQEGFNKALSIGMRQICKQLGLSGITYYWARHSVGNLARNVCRLSKDDVAEALNHVDQGRKTTDIYIDKDWKIVDELQLAVNKLVIRRSRKFERWKRKVVKIHRTTMAA
jgi:integrase